MLFSRIVNSEISIKPKIFILADYVNVVEKTSPQNTNNFDIR